MKKRHNVDNNIKKFYKMIQKGQVVFDNPIQRDDNQWTNMQKSKLIKSILVDYAIPSVYSIGIQDNDNNMIYSILDGKQRLTTIYQYINNEFQINSKLEDIEYEGHLYNIRNKKFEKLPMELQDAIYDYSLSMVYYTYLSDSELSEMFSLLNNGTPMSRQQKATAYMGVESARRMNELKDHPFMQINAYLPRTVKFKASDAEVITQSMMIIDHNYALDSFSGNNMDRYSHLLRDEKTYMFNIMKDILDYTHEALDFYSDTLVLRKTIIPVVLYIAKIAMDDNLDKDLFFKWVREFKNSLQNRGQIKTNYIEYTGTGSFSKNKVYGRVNAALKHYKEFIALEKNPVKKEQEELPIVF